MGQRRRKRSLAETRRRRFLIVMGLLVMLMIALSPLLIGSMVSPSAPVPGASLLP